MSWIRLEDTFYDNEKVEAAGFDGAGVYAMALSFCGRHLTDGFVPDRALRKFGPRGVSQRLTNRLVEVGLWQRVEGGYQIRDFTKENPTKAETLARRARDAARKRAKFQGDSERNPDGLPADSEGTGRNATDVDGFKRRDVSGGLSANPDLNDAKAIRAAAEWSLRSVEGGAA